MASFQASLDAITAILPLVSWLFFYIILSSTAEKAPASNASNAKGFYKIIICITINQLIQQSEYIYSAVTWIRMPEIDIINPTSQYMRNFKLTP
jgi:hypothetical protein